MVFPRFGDHHEHGFGQRVARQCQQLEGFIEASGVACSGCADRERLLKAITEDVGLQR